MIEHKWGRQLSERKIWSEDQLVNHEEENDFYIFQCRRSNCQYKISQLNYLQVEALTDSERMKLAEALRRAGQGTKDPILISDELLSGLNRIAAPSMEERVARGLRVITARHPNARTRVTLFGKERDESLYFDFLGATYSSSDAEVQGFLQHYSESGFLEMEITPNGPALGRPFRTKISAYINSSSSSEREGNAFVAMWFDASMDEVWTNAIDPAIRDAGYVPIRIDKQQFNDKIDDRILAEIRKAKFVVADFTCKPKEPRGGVYYEAGFAAGLSIPVIYTCRDNAMKDIHFDTQMFNHIVWKDTKELRSKLKDRIEATLGRGPNLKD